MSSTCTRLLVSAANGRTGRHVIEALRLTCPDTKIRAFARTHAEHADETVIGNLEDPVARAMAVDHVDTVVHYGPPMHPRETAFGTGMIDAATAAGVRRFIYISVINPQIDDLLNHKAKLNVEAYLLNSGLEWTILRPQHYMQTIDILRAIRDGAVVLPYDGDVKLGHVDLQDVAQAVAKVATEDGHAFAAYDLSSDELMTFSALCEVISRESGTNVVHRTSDIASTVKQISEFWPEQFTSYSSEGFHRLFGYYSRHGIRGNAAHLRLLLGREPSNFAHYVRRMINLDARITER